MGIGDYRLDIGLNTKSPIPNTKIKRKIIYNNINE